MAKNIAEFMTETVGRYYSKLGLFGKDGDFVTAPETSQIFGEVLGAWTVHAWQRNACPNPVQLVEMGPGTGAMMKDMLRTIRQISPEMYETLRIVMVEHSPILEEKQRETLATSDKINDARWIPDIRELPELPFIMVANEFFDCLPIHQVIKTEEGLRERLIDGDKFVLSNEEPSYLVPYMAREHLKAPVGSVIELCPYAVTIIGFIAERMNHSRSSALVVDYGYEEPQIRETLQAVKDHKFYPLLAHPGEVDITAHVDFSALRAAALQVRAKVYGPVKQGLWLKQMGIEERAQKLMVNASEKDKKNIEDAVARLIEPDRMGNLFKVMTFFSRF